MRRRSANCLVCGKKLPQSEFSGFCSGGCEFDFLDAAKAVDPSLEPWEDSWIAAVKDEIRQREELDTLAAAAGDPEC